MKKYIYTAVILVGFVLTTSCEDFLTTDNKSNVTDKEYFSTKTGFESLVSNAYSTLRDVYAVSSYTTYFNAGTDMYADGRNYINDELHEYETLNPENSVMKELYTACYKGIRAAYAIKHYAADAVIDENLRSRRVDEARVLAANYYYILVNTFGGVPLMKDYVADVQTGYPKSSVVDVYTYIIEELENVIAAGAMEKSTALDGGGRISIESARALLAKTYLAAAWDLDKKDYFAKAAQVADDVIANRALVTPFEDLWRADCREMITKNLFGMWNMTMLRLLIQSVVGIRGVPFIVIIWGGKKIMERGVLLLLLRLYMLCSVLKKAIYAMG